jgi:indolepyruvate ferredoxin oxidoreductase beta subunit
VTASEVDGAAPAVSAQGRDTAFAPSVGGAGSAASGARPVTILVGALGGQGGGVLAEWLVDAAMRAGYVAQSTSIPGVAQRTGATTYYVEVFPVPERELGGRVPVLSLAPVPGAIDLVVVSELLEAVRITQAGFVDPLRTMLVASTGRTLTTVEKMAPGDGRFPGGRLAEVAALHSRRLVTFDMDAAASEAGTIVSAVMFGAIAGSGVLPFAREACEAAITGSGAGAQASRRGFALGAASVAGGLDREAGSGREVAVPAPTVPQTATQSAQSAAQSPQTAAQSPQKAARCPQTAARSPQTAARSPQTAARSPQTAAQSPQTAAQSPQTAAQSPQTAAQSPQTAAQSSQTAAQSSQTAAQSSQSAAQTPTLAACPPDCRAIVDAGVDRVTAFQDRGYAALYLERVEKVRAAEVAADPGGEHGAALTREAARFLALWMAFDDIARVAGFKGSAARHERVRREVGAAAGDVVRVADFFKPGVPEFAGMLPPSIARRLIAWDRRRVAGGRAPFALPLELRSDAITGMIALRVLSSMRRLRRASQRYAEEQAAIGRWLDAVVAGAAADWRLGHEIALAGRLVKGYGETNARGKRNLGHILEHVAQGGEFATPAERAQAVREAREAALADEGGRALDAALVRHGAPPRPVEAKPIVWMKPAKPGVRDSGRTS